MGKSTITLLLCFISTLVLCSNISAAEKVPVVTEVFPTGAISPCGLVWDGIYFYTIDMKRDRIFKLHPKTLQLISSFPVLSSNPSNLAYNNGYLWVIEKDTNVIFQLDSSSFSTIRMLKLDYLEDEEMCDLAFYDNKFWILSRHSEGTHISVVDNLSKGNLKTYDLPGTDPAGIEWADDFLWYAENSSGTIYRYAYGDRLVPVDEYQSPTRDMAGFAYLCNELWIMEKETSNVVEFTVKRTSSRKVHSSYFINNGGWVTNLILQNNWKRDSRVDIYLYDQTGMPIKVFRKVEIPGNGVFVLPTKLYAPDITLGTIKIIVLEGKILGNTIKIDLETDTVFSDPLR